MTHIPYTIPLVTLRGAPFEIGRQMGEQVRERVLLHVLNQKVSIAKLRPDEPDWWKAHLKDLLKPYEELAPYFVEEMRGLAGAVGLPFEDILLLNLRDDLYARARPASVSGCTSFGCSGAVTLHGQPIIGQTKDTAPISKDLYIISAIYQQGRPDLLQLAYAGEFGVLGFGSGGVAIMGNSIYVAGPVPRSPAGRPKGGLPASLCRRLILQSNGVQEVVALADRYGFATCGSYTVGDRSGRVIALENTDHGHAVVEATDGISVHANHIDSPELVRYEVYPEPERSVSYHRQQRLAGQLSSERGRLTATMAMRCLMDHDRYPDCICRHPSAIQDLQTTAAMVVEPTLGRLHVVRGQPCQGWPATYHL